MKISVLLSIRIVHVTIMLGTLTCLSGCASRVFYYPTSRIYHTAAEYGCMYEEVTFPSKDDTLLNGWFIPASNTPTPKGTVLQFHGNAQNITAHISYVAWLAYEGFNVFLFDYRGYGKSQGKPSREGVYLDSCAALNYLRSRPDIDPDNIFILGQSLGGANALAAIQGTGTNGIRAVALDSAFYSYRKIVRDKIRQVPVLSLFRWPLSLLIISNTKSPSTIIDKISPIPVLIIHGTDDQVIPFQHGEKLYKKAEAPKSMIAVLQGHHCDALIQKSPVYRRQLLDFFSKVEIQPTD